jgi:predicted HTH transcriptional regulator
MNTEDLELLLDGGTETQSLDFKESCPWNANSFAKDILAMSNVQEGGTIIIGVVENDDGSFMRQGIKVEHRKTFNTDKVMDDLSKFADPYVQVSVKFVNDKNNTEYAVILVEPFKDVPVICKKDSSDTKIAGIYYRNRDGRPKSSMISNSFDMRDLIDRAVVKSAKRAREIGFVLPTSDETKKILKVVEDRMKKERGDL